MLVPILFLVQFIFVHASRYQQPLAEKLWSVRCSRSDHMLNDCNWCWCALNHYFQCQARVCEEVDKFGHFKDTILEHNVGMEGHGSWRSRPTSCTPGVQYQRGTVLCVCDEDGNWPNPVCRDLFRILHAVEVTEKIKEASAQSCSPKKLYLVGCNTCFCPSSGKLEANLCTNRTCSDGDPVLEIKQDEEETKKVLQPKDADEKSGAHRSKDLDLVDKDTEFNHPSGIPVREANKEIYASCNTKKTYSIGLQNCECLTNNRLICKEQETNIARGKKNSDSEIIKSICENKINVVIRMGCNICKCASLEYMYCTIKKCLNKTKTDLVVKKIPTVKNLVRAPIEDENCVPGTWYKRDCNICHCSIEDGQKMITCTVRACYTTQYDLLTMAKDCVTGTTYRNLCNICVCEIIKGKKYELCRFGTDCEKTVTLKNRSANVEDLSGHCEPYKEYVYGCKLCKCSSNGKILRCSTKVCVARSAEPVEVDIVPFQQKNSEPCPKGHSYKIGCNLCFCLSNGNALCTSSDCSKQTDEARNL